MPRFLFKLEPVLDQRKRIEQDKQRLLAIRSARLLELENELKRMDEKLRHAAEELRRNHLTGPIDLSFLTAHRRFLGGMQREGLALAHQIAQQHQVVDEARRQLFEAAKRRKAIARLRERHFERWRQDLARREQAELDEIGAQISYANLSDEAAR